MLKMLIFSFYYNYNITAKSTWKYKKILLFFRNAKLHKKLNQQIKLSTKKVEENKKYKSLLKMLVTQNVCINYF